MPHPSLSPASPYLPLLLLRPAGASAGISTARLDRPLPLVAQPSSVGSSTSPTPTHPFLPPAGRSNGVWGALLEADAPPPRQDHRDSAARASVRREGASGVPPHLLPRRTRQTPRLFAGASTHHSTLPHHLSHHFFTPPKSSHQYALNPQLSSVISPPQLVSLSHPSRVITTTSHLPPPYLLPYVPTIPRHRPCLLPWLPSAASPSTTPPQSYATKHPPSRPPSSTSLLTSLLTSLPPHSFRPFFSRQLLSATQLPAPLRPLGRTSTLPRRPSHPPSSHRRPHSAPFARSPLLHTPCLSPSLRTRSSICARCIWRGWSTRLTLCSNALHGIIPSKFYSPFIRYSTSSPFSFHVHLLLTLSPSP